MIILILLAIAVVIPMTLMIVDRIVEHFDAKTEAAKFAQATLDARYAARYARKFK